VARTWLARAAGNAVGFAVCYLVLADLLWALGQQIVAPLVPRPPDAVFYHCCEDFLRAQSYVRTVSWAMAVPSALAALVLLGSLRWRRQLWLAPGPLLGLLLGDLRDYAVVWYSHFGGQVQRLDPSHTALLAHGLGLLVGVWLPQRLARRMPATSVEPITRRARLPRPHRWQSGTLALTLLALTAASLAGCENSTGHHVGDTISNATVRITLTSVTVAPADATDQPAAGDELVRVHVRYTSNANTVLSFNEVQFAMQNGAATGNCGKVQGVSCSYPLDGTYIHYSIQDHPGVYGYLLQPGATLESDILFEVGKNAHDARLMYQPDGMQDIANFWWLLGL
jgi:hypothetical protein